MRRVSSRAAVKDSPAEPGELQRLAVVLEQLGDADLGHEGFAIGG